MTSNRRPRWVHPGGAHNLTASPTGRRILQELYAVTKQRLKMTHDEKLNRILFRLRRVHQGKHPRVVAR
jgi:hypothetical protein